MVTVKLYAELTETEKLFVVNNCAMVLTVTNTHALRKIFEEKNPFVQVWRTEEGNIVESKIGAISREEFLNYCKENIKSIL